MKPVLLLLPLSFLFCGAIEPAHSIPHVPVRAAHPRPLPVPLELRPLFDALERVPRYEATLLVRDADQYQAYFGHPAPEVVDWTHEMVVFYGGGVIPTGVAHAGITSAELVEDGGAILVHTLLIQAVPDLPGAGGPSVPYALARIPRPASEVHVLRAVHEYALML